MSTCPRCNKDTLVSYPLKTLGIESADGEKSVVRGLSVSSCESCNGVLFDAGDAELLLGSSDTLMSLSGSMFLGDECGSCGATDNVPGALKCANCAADLGLSCPSCKGRMLLAQVLNVEIDICNECQACWFDDGEVTKVQKRFHRRKRREERRANEPEEREEKGSAWAINDASKAAPKSQKADPPADTPLPTKTCIKCGTEGLRPRDVYKTAEGPVCRKCMSGGELSEGRGLSIGMMNEGGVASRSLDAMATSHVVDAIVDLFSAGKS